MRAALPVCELGFVVLTVEFFGHGALTVRQLPVLVVVLEAVVVHATDSPFTFSSSNWACGVTLMAKESVIKPPFSSSSSLSKAFECIDLPHPRDHDHGHAKNLSVTSVDLSSPVEFSTNPDSERRVLDLPGTESDLDFEGLLDLPGTESDLDFEGPFFLAPAPSFFRPESNFAQARVVFCLGIGSETKSTPSLSLALLSCLCKRCRCRPTHPHVCTFFNPGFILSLGAQ